MPPEHRPERRRHRRHDVSIEGKIHIPLPEEGSAVLIAKVTIRNLCENGANVKFHKLRKEHIPALVRERRKCFLTCQLPGFDVPSTLSGEIAWIVIRTDQDPATAFLGIELTDTAPDERERLKRYLETLPASQ